VSLRASARLLLALALCGVATAAAGDTEIEDVDAAEFRFGSMAIGQAKDVDFARAEGLGLVPSFPLGAYLNGILTTLVSQSPVRNVPARVYVRASGDFGAKSTADANVYVSLGALLRLDDEDEVAALLAHEASHVILGHADTDVVASMQQRAIQLTALAADVQDVLSASGVAAGTGVGGSARADEQSQALLLNSMLVSPAWTREQERDADRLGVDLLARAGYSPRAMASLLQKQKSFESERAADPEMSLLDQKVVGFDARQTTSNQVREATRGVGGAAGGGALGDLADAAIGKAFEWGSKKVDQAQRSHPKTEERIADVEEYVEDEYEDEAGRAVKVEAWEQAKEADGTVDILENYIAAIEAQGKLADGDTAGARRLAKTSLSGPTKAHAYPN
jgi:predicted Zn-dependent protease